MDILKNNHFLYIRLISDHWIHSLQLPISNIHKTLTLDILSINAYHIIRHSFDFCWYVSKNYKVQNLLLLLPLLTLLLPNNFGRILILSFVILFHLPLLRSVNHQYCFYCLTFFQFILKFFLNFFWVLHITAFSMYFNQNTLLSYFFQIYLSSLLLIQLLNFWLIYYYFQDIFMQSPTQYSFYFSLFLLTIINMTWNYILILVL